MAMQSVWNITDDPRTEHEPQSIMVLGRNLKPGQRCQVDEERLKTAHKVQRLVEAGLLYVGPRPPAVYLTMKNPPRARLDESMRRTHGPSAGAAPEEAPEEAKVEAKVEEVVEPPMEELTASTSMGRKKKRRKGTGEDDSSSETSSSESSSEE